MSGGNSTNASPGLADARLSLDMVLQCHDLLDRIRDLMGGNPLMHNNTWAQLHDAYRSTAGLLDSLDLIVMGTAGLEALPVVYPEPDPED